MFAIRFHVRILLLPVNLKRCYETVFLNIGGGTACAIAKVVFKCHIYMYYYYYSVFFNWPPVPDLLHVKEIAAAGFFVYRLDAFLVKQPVSGADSKLGLTMG